MRRILFAAMLAASVLAGPARGDIAVVVEHQWTIDNNYFSAFAFDPVYQEFRTGGYSSNQTVRWSQILDDTVEPWVMDGDVLLNWFQLGIFAKDGFASNSGSFSLWGMNFNPLDGRYFLTGIGILKAPGSSDRLATERDLIMLDSNLPNSRLTLPTGVTISNVGGTYKLVDTSENGTFVSSGVQVGDTVTMFPVDIWAEVNSGTFTITQVVSETEHPAVAELAELTDRYLRLAADYDNFRKRTARERAELESRARADLARRLLEALDDLGRVAHLDPATTVASDVIAGVELVERKVLRELGAVGLERVADTDVPFDPTYHEAIATVAAASEAEDHTVAAVFQVGYRFNGMLLRPARVQVRIWAAPAPA